MEDSLRHADPQHRTLALHQPRQTRQHDVEFRADKLVKRKSPRCQSPRRAPRSATTSRSPRRCSTAGYGSPRMDG